MNPGYQQGYYPPQYNYPPPQPQRERNSGPAQVVKIVLGILAPLAWLIALALPAYNQYVYGVFCLAMGWSMIITGNVLAFLAWFSNLPFWIGFFLFVIGNKHRGKIAAIVLSATALVLSFGALTVTKVVGVDSSTIYQSDDYMKPAVPNYGMYIWMISYALLLIGAVAFVMIRNNAAAQNQVPQIPQPPPQPFNPYDPGSMYPPVDPYAQYPPQLPEDTGKNPWENP